MGTCGGKAMLRSGCGLGPKPLKSEHWFERTCGGCAAGSAGPGPRWVGAAAAFRFRPRPLLRRLAAVARCGGLACLSRSATSVCLAGFLLRLACWRLFLRRTPFLLRRPRRPSFLCRWVTVAILRRLLCAGFLQHGGRGWSFSLLVTTWHGGRASCRASQSTACKHVFLQATKEMQDCEPCGHSTRTKDCAPLACRLAAGRIRLCI